jgi:hypothetical protein
MTVRRKHTKTPGSFARAGDLKLLTFVGRMC